MSEGDWQRRLESAENALRAALGARDKAQRALETYLSHRLQLEYETVAAENQHLRTELANLQSRRGRRRSIEATQNPEDCTSIEALTSRISALQNLCSAQKTLLEQCCDEVNNSRAETQALVDVVEQLNKQIANMVVEQQRVEPKFRLPDRSFLDEVQMDLSFGPEREVSVLEPRESFMLLSKPQVAAQLQAVEQTMEQLKAAVADNTRLVEPIVRPAKPAPKKDAHKNYLQKSLQKRSSAPWKLA